MNPFKMTDESIPIFSRIYYQKLKVDSFIPHDKDSNLTEPIFRNGKFYFPHFPKKFYLRRIFFKNLFKAGSINFIYCLNEIIKEMDSTELWDFIVHFERETNKEEVKIYNSDRNLYGFVCIIKYGVLVRNAAQIIKYFPQWIQSAYQYHDKLIQEEKMAVNNLRDNSDQDKIEYEILKRKLSELNEVVLAKTNLISELESKVKSLESEIEELCSLKWDSEISEIVELADALVCFKRFKKGITKETVFLTFNKIFGLNSNIQSMSTAVTKIRVRKREPNYRGEFLIDLEKSHVAFIKNKAEEDEK